MYFICGVHGVGKTNFAQNLSKQMNIPYYNAGELIRKNVVMNEKGKLVDSVNFNQIVLLEEIDRLGIKGQNVILDGHLCLLNRNEQIERIDSSILKRLNIKEIFIVIEKVETIQKNLKRRDAIIWSVDLIEKMQNLEIQYALEISHILSAKLHIIYRGHDVRNLANIEENNLLLPIKPVHVEKILVGSKKYEYRKKLCKNEIQKMYIYASSPIKMIVGEAEVIGKIEKEKEALWKLTKNQSGISYEFFKQYFEKCEYACAYKIGKTISYKKGIPLKELGIEKAPQSYMYIGDLDEYIQNSYQ